MEDRYYAIVVGDKEDWTAQRGSIYFVEHRSGERWLLVFTTLESAKKHIGANFELPEAHMEMLESMALSHTAPLTAGRFSIISLDFEGVVKLAQEIGASHVQRNITEGPLQEVMVVPEPEEEN
jgi:hypothetical protein